MLSSSAEMDNWDLGMFGDGDSAFIDDPLVQSTLETEFKSTSWHQAADFHTSEPVDDTRSPDIDAKAAHQEKLKREADGIFAGMTLPNEMEPLGDSYEPDVDWGSFRSTIRGAKIFLNGLQPASSGGIKCAGCVWRNGGYNFSEPFPCTIQDIKAHYRHCVCRRQAQDEEPLYGALEMILHRAGSKALLADLQQQCKMIQLRPYTMPDIDEFLSQLDVLPNGNLRCSKMRCGVLKGFEFSSEWIQHHFRVHHCLNSAREFMFDTNTELEEFISLQFEQSKAASIMKNSPEALINRNAIARRISELTDFKLKQPLGTECSYPEHSLEIKKPGWEQLRVLRTLRAKFIVHHRQFLQLTAESPFHGLQKLRKSCRRYSDLLDTGILTFKAIMNDESPSSLKEVFAFISLTYAMTGAMQSRGNPVRFCLDKYEMEGWRKSLTDLEDRHTLDQLVLLLWSKVQEPQVNEVSRRNPFISSLDRWLCLFNSPPSLKTTAERLLETSSSDERFCFGDWLNISDSDNLPLQFKDFNSACLKHDIWTEVPKNKHASDADPYSLNTDCPFETQHTSQRGDKTSLVQSQSLAQSLIFIQAISFLIFIGGMGILLLYLSGNNENYFSTKKCTFTASNMTRYTRFLEVIKFRVLNPLCLDSNLVKFHPLFRTTVKILEAGWLRSVRDVEKYLILLVKTYLPVCGIEDSQYSLNASKDDHIDDDYLYQGGPQTVDGYNPEYVTKRKEEEAALFVENSTAFDDVNLSFASGSNLEQSMDVEDSYDELSLSEPSSKRRRTSPVTSSSTNDAPIYSSSDGSEASTQPDHPSPQASREVTSRKCNVEGCGRVYLGSDSANSLARHKREKHSPRSSFICPFPYCGHESRRLHNLRAHWETKHEGKGMAQPEWLAATRSRGGGGMKRKGD